MFGAESLRPGLRLALCDPARRGARPPAPIVIAWLGFGIASKIALGAIACLFPVCVNRLADLTREEVEQEVAAWRKANA